MKSYKIAVSYDMSDYISTHRECVDILHTDFSDVAVIIISLDDIQNGKLNLIEKIALNSLFLPLLIKMKLSLLILLID